MKGLLLAVSIGYIAGSAVLVAIGQTTADKALITLGWFFIGMVAGTIIGELLVKLWLDQ